MTVITRFAPSPTGSLHLGGARTALFNWLYAKNQGGKFLLRIEDTDILRSKNIYTQQICDSLRWLNLNWDGEIFFQSKNASEHIKHAKLLLDKGLAYKCYCTKDELNKEKELALKKKVPYKYSRKCRDLKESLNKKYVLRIKNPKDGFIKLQDNIQDTITVEYKNLEDFIILRSDNTPTYMLAVVVDDYAMNVTDVIRGDDHLTNTFKQIILYNAFNWKLPNFSHIPLIYGSDGAKLSKRHGAQSVLEYKKNKLFPEALNNYLLRLGWGYKNKEYFSIEEAIDLFNIKGIGKSPSRFDAIKLRSVNTHYFKKLTNDKIFKILKSKYSKYDDNKISQLIDLFKNRAENINDIEEGISYMCNDNVIDFTEDALKLIEKADKNIMIQTINKLERIDLWEATHIEHCIKEEVKKNNIKMFDIAAPIRSSITGKTFSPSIFLVLEKLGKEVSIKRLKKNYYEKT